MKKRNLLISVLGMLAIASAAFGAELGDISWDQSNLETLRSFNEADVARFLESEVEKLAIEPLRLDESVTTDDVQEFTWANLFGGPQYQLVVVSTPLGSAGANFLVIYTRNSAGKINEETIKGQAIHLAGWKNRPYIPKVIQDLDGDGKDELIIPAELGMGLYGAAPVAIWPQVYRLQNGTYVEASRDFAKFYDSQVLPILETGISNAREAAAEEARKMPGAPLKDRTARQMLDTLIITRDKILRVIGRDPKAGEQQAREWVTGPDPDPFFAMQVFEDMGDHEEDLEAAQRELEREVDAGLKAAGISK